MEMTLRTTAFSGRTTERKARSSARYASTSTIRTRYGNGP